MKPFVVMLILGVLLCGSITVRGQQGATPTPDANSEDSSYTLVDVAHSVALDKIRADLMSSHTLWASGDYKSAAAHAADANADFNAIINDLAAQYEDANLKKLLDAYTALAGQAGDSKQIDDAFQAAMDHLDNIEQVWIGPNMTDVEFQGAVSIDLLQLIELDYGQAVKDGKLMDPANYQMAAALLILTRSRWQNITTGIELDNAETIQAQFDAIGKALPDVIKVPEMPVTLDDLSKTADALIDAIRSALQLSTPIDATEAA